jgi:hypothetical protein
MTLACYQNRMQRHTSPTRRRNDNKSSQSARSNENQSRGGLAEASAVKVAGEAGNRRSPISIVADKRLKIARSGNCPLNGRGRERVGPPVTPPAGSVQIRVLSGVGAEGRGARGEGRTARGKKTRE